MELELCWGTLAGTGPAELLAAAAPAGFAGVTVRPDMARDSPGGPGALRRLAEDLGVRVTQLDPLVAPLPGVPSAGDVEEPVRGLFEVGLEECLDLAEAVGAESVNLAHFRGDPLVPESSMAEATARVCAAAERRGLRVSFEFFSESAVPTVQAADRLYRALRAPNFGVLVDTLHLLRGGGAAADVAALPAGAVGALQVADRGEVDPEAPYVPMTGRALPGEGILPVGPAVEAALDRARPGLRAGIEVFDAALRERGPTEAASLAAASMRRLLASLGD